MAQIERMLRKELRVRKVLDPTEPVAIVDDGSMRCKVAQLLLSRIVHGGVELIPEGTRRRRNVARATSLELELVLGLRAFLEDGVQERREVRVMATVPEAEIVAFACRNGIPVEHAPPDDVRAFIERLQESQPQTKHALLKSLAAIEGMSRKKRLIPRRDWKMRRPTGTTARA